MKYAHHKSIINAAQRLAGSKAKTEAGAWKALRKWIAAKPSPFDGGRRPVHWWNYRYNQGLSPRQNYELYIWRERAERGGEAIMRELKLKTRWENITAGGTDEWERDLYATKPEMYRDEYGALHQRQYRAINWGAAEMIRESWHRDMTPLALAKKCVSDVEALPDEHGGWERRSEWDDKGRGEQISVDIYGTDPDNSLHVIQVRQAYRAHKNYYLSVRKSYFLIGYNENGNAFAHSISAAIVHAAIKRDPSPESPVRAAQAWIWGITEDRLPEVLRNGDVALVPVKSTPKTGVEIDTTGRRRIRIIDSHWIYSKEIRINGAIYAHNPTLRHMKRQHPTQKGKGWYKVIIGRRAKTHDFARPTVD